jgi:hypothetical protein
MQPSSSTAEPPPPGERINRIAAAGTLDTLERIQNANIVGSGLVNMIGIDAIRDKLADQWQRKAPRVWEHLERELERTLGPTGIFVRLDDTSYLIAQPGEEGFAAQAVCLTILQDVLKFFLGELRHGDINVRSVSDVADGVISSTPLDPVALHKRAATPPTAAERSADGVNGPLADHAPAPKDWQPPLAGRTLSIPLTPPKRPPINLHLRVEPVWNLRRGVITSFLINRDCGPGPFEAVDLEEIDVATAAYVATLLVEHAQQGGQLALHVPFNYMTLSTLRSRERLARLTRPVGDSMRSCVVIEIDGLDAGVPPSRLIEVVGLIRALCAGVLGRVRPSKSALAAVRGCGLRGVVALSAWLAPQGPQGVARLKAYSSMARDIVPNVLIHGLPNADLIDEATTAGFTHASVVGGDDA